MSLQLPHDIIEPTPIGWWPPAPGWWALLLLLIVTVVLLLRWYWRRHRAFAPLRQALQEHQQLSRQWQQQRDARETTAALSALLKRVARHYYPHEPVSALTGAAWQEFLLRTGAGAFDDTSVLAFAQFYQAQVASELTPPLEPARRWLQAQRKRRAPTNASVRAGVPNHV